MGWLWMNAVRTDDTLAVDLYRDAACEAGDKVATGSADISTIAEGPVKVALSPANDSGMSGELFVESCLSDVGDAAVLVSLCVDADLAEHYHRIDAFPSDVYDPTSGMARHCAAATRKTLLLASQMYADQLGGFGGPEDRRLAAAAREVPDFRRIVAPDQLKEAAVHWALMLAAGSCHDRAQETIFSRMRDYHDAKRKEAIAAWNLTFNMDPDVDDQADQSRSTAMVRSTRL
jgi:hypothetical protein